MQTEQSMWSRAEGWAPAPSGELAGNLVFVFGSRDLVADRARMDDIRECYPGALVIGCSTAGEIAGTRVYDDTLVVTAVRFDHSRVLSAQVVLDDFATSFDAGVKLAASLPADGLRHVFVLSDGIVVNGSELARGMTESLPSGVSVTGGLSADGARFERTLVVTADSPLEHTIAAVGLYGSQLEIGFGSLGGWDPFGPERLITRSAENVLHELDGQCALDLYKRYLGEHASGLPATGLLFPLAVRAPESDAPLVRTILSVDEDAKSLTFAGDVPTGWFARLMRANFDRLVDGAQGAAKNTVQQLGQQTPDLALLVSCVGRKMVLKSRVEEEVEAVGRVLGSTMMTGFYSYGEISPVLETSRCELHNQTMTITTISER